MPIYRTDFNGALIVIATFALSDTRPSPPIYYPVCVIDFVCLSLSPSVLLLLLTLFLALLFLLLYLYLFLSVSVSVFVSLFFPFLLGLCHSFCCPIHLPYCLYICYDC